MNGQFQNNPNGNNLNNMNELFRNNGQGNNPFGNSTKMGPMEPPQKNDSFKPDKNNTFVPNMHPENHPPFGGQRNDFKGQPFLNNSQFGMDNISLPNEQNMRLLPPFGNNTNLQNQNNPNQFNENSRGPNANGNGFGNNMPPMMGMGNNGNSMNNNNFGNQRNGQNRPQFDNNMNPNGNMQFPNNGNNNNMMNQENINNNTNGNINGTVLDINKLSMKKGNSDNETLIDSNSKGFLIRNSFILIMFFISLL